MDGQTSWSDPLDRTRLTQHWQQLERYSLPIILTLALLLRVYLLLTVLAPIESDEAVIGLMAQHIWHGARTLFDYDILYHGPLESYLTAPLFALFGMNRTVLRIVPLGFSIAFVWAVYWLGSKLYGRRIGLFSALYSAFPPPMLTIWGLKAGAGYIVVLALGTIGLALAADLKRKASPAKTLVLLLVLALGFWVQYVTGYYIAAIVLVWVSGQVLRRAASASRPASPGLRVLAAALVIGGLLALCYLVSVVAAMSPADLVRSLTGIVTTAFPVLLGSWQPSVSDALFSSQIAERGMLYAPSVGLSLAVCMAVLWIGAKRLKEGDPLLPFFVATTIIAFSAFWIMFHLSPALLQEPRYLLPLYSAIPLAILAVFRLTHKTAWLRPVLLVGILTFNLYSNLTIRPALNLPHLHGETLADNQALIDWLNEQDIRHVYADYWIGYWLAFDSQERIVPFIITFDGQVGWNRYPSYAAEVEHSTHPAYIFIAGSEDERAFVNYLASQNIQYQVQSIAPYTVYWNLSRRVHLPLRLPTD